MLTQDFFSQPDVCQIARQLVGCSLITQTNGVLTAGIITETEAYRGTSDRACHAFGGRKTPRNQVMYGPAGFAYVYLCYGMHHLFNVVTNAPGTPDAVLIRAIEPTHGLDAMLARRNLSQPKPQLTTGPGSMSKAMGIGMQHNKLPLFAKKHIWIEKPPQTTPPARIAALPRIGVQYAKEDALLPYRYCLINSKYVSLPRPK